MPARNIIKTYYQNGYYHVYNRAIEKRPIFLDDQDCIAFLYYLKVYLSPIELLTNTSNKKMNRFVNVNLSQELDLLCFTLMPNHFHFLLKQYDENSITKFMRRLITAYVMYFNRKYNRVGGLFQNIFKACNITNDSYLLHLTRYIHLNPKTLTTPINFNNFSSYPYYLGQKHANWIKPNEILEYFNSSKKSFDNTSSYFHFVENENIDSGLILGDLILEQND